LGQPLRAQTGEKKVQASGSTAPVTQKAPVSRALQMARARAEAKKKATAHAAQPSGSTE
jgi:hypothetical protein